MYYEQVAEKGYKFLLQKLQEQSKMNSDEGGKLRATSGNNVELLVDYIFNCFQEHYNNSDITISIGRFKPIYITLLDGTKYAESVDRHIYKNDKLIYAIECKTYLDKCSLSRVYVDYSLMKAHSNSFIGTILSIENAVKDEAYNLFMSAPYIDRVFYLATGKRSPKIEQRIYYHPERISLELFKEFCKHFEEVVFA